MSHPENLTQIIISPTDYWSLEATGANGEKLILHVGPYIEKKKTFKLAQCTFKVMHVCLMFFGLHLCLKNQMTLRPGCFL